MVHSCSPGCFPKGDSMTTNKDSAVTPDVRSGRKLPLPVPRPGPGGISRPPPLPGPDWNGIPGYPGGDCQKNLMVNLTLNRDFCGPMTEEVEHCIHHHAIEMAGEEMAQENPGIPRPRLGRPPEDRVNHWKNSLDVIENCLEDFVCPILRRATEHHKQCNHEQIVILLPDKYAQQIMALRCWEDFAKFLNESNVEWYPVS